MSDVQQLETKVDRLTALIEEVYESRLRVNPGPVLFDLACGGIIGYFLFKILDYHFNE